MNLSDAERAIQLAHCAEAIALCEHQSMPAELAAAQAMLERDPTQPQAELILG